MADKKQQRGRPRHDPGQPWHGDALRVRRNLRGLTVQGLADALGVAKSTVLRWESSVPGAKRPSNPPSREQLRAIAQYFGCPMRAFTKRPKLVS